MIVTNIECGMYLIAACLPSLRIVIRSIYTIASNNLTSFVARYRGHAHDNGQSRVHANDKVDTGQKTPEVGVKLTGAGKLDTLMREVDRMDGPTTYGH